MDVFLIFVMSNIFLPSLYGSSIFHWMTDIVNLKRANGRFCYILFINVHHFLAGRKMFSIHFVLFVGLTSLHDGYLVCLFYCICYWFGAKKTIFL